MPREEPVLVSEITDIETIAVGSSIRELADLRADYGGDRWRKLKGRAYVQRKDGRIIFAEVHWHPEGSRCHGIGRRRMKVKRELK